MSLDTLSSLFLGADAATFRKHSIATEWAELEADAVLMVAARPVRPANLPPTPEWESVPQ